MTITKQHKLTAVELFCGIGGFRIAADRLGLKTIWANDINDLACSVYRNRFGQDILHEGDITSLSDCIPNHDILTAGFPCQPFSSAGKKEGIRDPRGTLFQSIVDVIEKTLPKYFVLENVKRLLSMEHGTHFATVLSALSALDYFIEWRVLNAKDFGLAQNRERVVIVGSRTESLNGDAQDTISRLNLANVTDIASGPRGIKSLLNQPTTWKSLDKNVTKFPLWGVALRGKFFACDLDLFSSAMPPAYLKEILEKSPSSEYDYTEKTLERLHLNETVNRYINGVEIISNQAGGARMGYTIFGVGGVAPTLTASTSRHYERYQIGERYRRLTPHEYARLQGFSDEHCNIVANYDQYSLYGNAVPPPIVEWVLRQVIDERITPANSIPTKQPELFDA